jgi:hypothetical protein
MSTEVSIMPHSQMLDMAKLFAESGMFPDMKTMGMAFVKIQAGKEIGISPFAAMSGIHIIQGKATIGAGLMAGCVKGSPKYDYKVTAMDEKICTINFTTKDGKLLGTSSFTIDEAKKAGTKNLDKFPKNMLFARAMSNGVKWFCPDVFTMPVYTPEELGDPSFTEDVQHELIDTKTGEVKQDPKQATDPKPEKLSKADLKTAEAMLRSSTTLDELKHNFEAIGATARMALGQVKDELKIALTPLPGVAIVQPA